MATSVVPTVRKKLRDQLKARAALARVQITTGNPQSPDAEYVALLGADEHEQRQAGMRSAPHPREEDFVLQVRISVVQAGHADSESVVDRAFALAAELENEIRDDMTIGGSLGNGWAEIEGLPFEDLGPNEEGLREARIHARVHCRARI